MTVNELLCTECHTSTLILIFVSGTQNLVPFYAYPTVSGIPSFLWYERADSVGYIDIQVQQTYDAVQPHLVHLKNAANRSFVH